MGKKNTLEGSQVGQGTSEVNPEKSILGGPVEKSVSTEN